MWDSRPVWPKMSYCDRRNIMAKSGNRNIIKLKSTESPYFYTTTKNKSNKPGKLELRKYDPIVRMHVLFRESK